MRGRVGVALEIWGEQRVATGHRDLARSERAHPLIPGHREDIGRRIFQQFQPVVAGIAGKRRVDGRHHVLAVGRIGMEPARDRVEVQDGLAEIRAGHQELMPERCAPGRVPGDPIAPALRVVEMARGCDQLLGGLGQVEPRLGKQNLAVEQKLRRCLAGHPVWPSTPMRGHPPGRMEIRRVETIRVEAGIERQQHALLGELPDPGQVDRDDVIFADPALGIAQRLVAQPVDGERALADIGDDDLFK